MNVFWYDNLNCDFFLSISTIIFADEYFVVVLKLERVKLSKPIRKRQWILYSSLRLFYQHRWYYLRFCRLKTTKVTTTIVIAKTNLYVRHSRLGLGKKDTVFLTRMNRTGNIMTGANSRHFQFLVTGMRNYFAMHILRLDFLVLRFKKQGRTSPAGALAFSFSAVFVPTTE